MLRFLLPLFATLGPALPAGAVVTLRVEAPGATRSTLPFDLVGIETFDGVSRGSPAGFTTDFGTGGRVVAHYSGGRVDSANRYGSADGAGQHLVAFSHLQPIDIRFTTMPAGGLSHFGLWWSALDAGNRLDMFRGDTLVASVDAAMVRAATGPCPGGPWCGNPSGPFAGQVRHEPYAFVHLFLDQGHSFDRLRLHQLGGGGFESDNHMIGLAAGGGIVPEPATWAMLIAGFMAVGAAARRRRRSRTRAAVH